MSRLFRHVSPHRESSASDARQDFEYGLVGGVVAYENRNAPGKRREQHQSDDGAAFAVLHGFDFNDRFAAQDLQVGIRLTRDDRRNLAVKRFALLRRQPIMQGKRGIFVFGDDAAVERRESGEPPLD